MKRVILLAGLILTAVFTINAQIQYAPLKVGEKVPDIVFRNMSNYHRDSASIKDFQGKLLILDFWSINCSPCIAGFQKMEKLQQKFGDKIQILLVNGINALEKLGGKENFPKNSPNSIIRSTHLPFVFQSLTQKENEEYRYGNEDKGTLTSLFQHAGEPFHVWIDQKGMVVALTTGQDTNEQTIQAVLEGKKADLQTKNYPSAIAYSRYGSFLRSPNDLVLSKLQYSSVITKNLFTKHGVGSGWLSDSLTNNIIGYRKMNSDIITLFKNAYDFKGEGTYKVVLEVKNFQPFVLPNNPTETADWKANNIYCYELMLPPFRITPSNEANMNTIRDIMRRNLEDYFGIKGNIETRKINCLVLNRTNRNISLKSSQKETVIEATDKQFRLSHVSFEAFVTSFRVKVNGYKGGTPIIDETGLDSIKIDMIINANLSDISAVKKELLRYGIGIKEEQREFNVLLLKQEEGLK